jgi:hypothetical protein
MTGSRIEEMDGIETLKTTCETRRRITFADVKRLRRDIAADGILTREEAELLLELDASVAKADASWTDWLVASVVDFAVWGERPTGTVEGEAASWLTQALTQNGLRTKAARLIAREIAREAQSVDAGLSALAEDSGMDLAPAPGAVPEAIEPIAA